MVWELIVKKEYIRTGPANPACSVGANKNILLDYFSRPAQSVCLTNYDILNINTIDKITHVCYTQNKLENKINILTNHN